VADRWSLTFSDNCSATEGIERWQTIVESALSFSQQLSEATDLGLKNQDTVRNTLDDFQALIAATAEANRPRYDEFARLIA
jgi:hypothetical protein